MKKVKISASMAHLDHGHMYDQIAEASEAGVDYIHLDSSDMVSIPTHPLMGGGAEVVKGIRKATDCPIEVHAHVHYATEGFINGFADAGANLMILPAIYYLDANLVPLVQACRSKGMKFGMTITIGAPLCLVDEAIYFLDRLHIHTHDVTPGIPLRDSALPMLRKARQMIDECNPSCELAADGGLTPENVHKVVEVGADVIIMCRQIFQAEDGISAGVNRIREALDKAEYKG